MDARSGRRNLCILFHMMIPNTDVTDSNEDRICYTLSHLLYCLFVCGKWLILVTATWQLCREMGRVPSNQWYRVWSRPASCTTLAVFLVQGYTGFANIDPIQAIIAIQAVVTGEELSSAMAFLVFAQSLAPAIALTLYNVIFAATLKAQLALRSPNQNAQAIIDAGATGFHAIIEADELPSILVAYSDSIDRVFYLVAALAASCGVFVWGMGWHDVRKKAGADKEVGHTEKGRPE